MKVGHEVHGDHVIVTLEVDATALVSLGRDEVVIALEDLEFRHAAKAILRECNAVEHHLPAESVVQRVRDALGDAALRAEGADTARVARMRLASSVLHRLADMVQSGTVQDFEIEYARGADVVRVSFATERRRASVLVKLGVGVIDDSNCGCPPGLLDDRGWPIHLDTCPQRVT